MIIVRYGLLNKVTFVFRAKFKQVLETADLLSEVTESVDYYVQGKTLAAGNLFGRWVFIGWY